MPHKGQEHFSPTCCMQQVGEFWPTQGHLAKVIAAQVRSGKWPSEAYPENRTLHHRYLIQIEAPCPENLTSTEAS